MATILVCFTAHSVNYPTRTWIRVQADASKQGTWGSKHIRHSDYLYLAPQNHVRLNVVGRLRT